MPTLPAGCPPSSHTCRRVYKRERRVKRAKAWWAERKKYKIGLGGIERGRQVAGEVAGGKVMGNGVECCSGRCRWAGPLSGEVCVLFGCAAQLVWFSVRPLFVVEEVMRKPCDICAILTLFPNLWIAAEQVCSFKTSVTAELTLRWKVRS